MTESEFAIASGELLSRIEEAIDAVDLDIDFERKGDGVLEIEFADRSRVIVNAQAPMRQIWVAAKSGGFHFEFGGGWRDTRTGESLMVLLARVISEQARVAVDLG